METITREELKAKIDRGEKFVLLEKGPESLYRKAHLPGAILLRSVREAPKLLPRDKDAEIIVYCLNFNCHSSDWVVRKLTDMGYTNVKDYRGGKHDWVGAGLPIESEEHLKTYSKLTDGG
jgi:rhodanese-related sulfurtransferase